MLPAKKKTTTRTRLHREDPPEEQVPAKNTLVVKRSYFYSFLAVVTFIAGIFVGYMIWGYQPEPKPFVYDIETEGFPSLGPDDAPIVIVEFSDYQCPFCWRWYNQTYQPLLDAYPGKIRMVFRNYPLSFHPNAFASAEAALCAGDQGAYWEYHNALFDNYLALYEQDQGRVLEQATYNQFASQLGLNVQTFETCMTSRKYEQFVLDDIKYANSLPPDVIAGEAAVGGTPTFFVNGHRLGGAYPLEEFRKIIDAELKKLD